MLNQKKKRRHLKKTRKKGRKKTEMPKQPEGIEVNINLKRWRDSSDSQKKKDFVLSPTSLPKKIYNLNHPSQSTQQSSLQPKQQNPRAIPLSLTLPLFHLPGCSPTPTPKTETLITSSQRFKCPISGKVDLGGERWAA